MIRGTTKNIAILPVANKNIDPIEAIVPNQIDLRNGKLTDAGNWTRRPGYAADTNLDILWPVHLLIPDGSGIAITQGQGAAYDMADNSQIGSTTLTNTNRPQYVIYKPTNAATKQIIIVDGGTPLKIESATTAALGGSPNSFKYIDTLDTYVIGCGHNDVDFNWSNLEDAETWTAADKDQVLGDGESIMYFLVWNRMLCFFKSDSLEFWQNVGGDNVFARTAFIERGCGASYSVVKANQTLHWYGNDGDFYRLQGQTPTIISELYRKELDTLIIPSEIYGFDFRKESVIRWFAPTDKKVFKFDYRKGVFGEDNGWADGAWTSLPVNSYMELGGKALIGDRDQTGNIYEWSSSINDDGGNPIRMYRRFSVPLAQDSMNARANRLRVRTKRGMTSGVSDPVAQLRWRVDKGDWIPFQNIPLGNVGDRYPYYDIYNLGIGIEAEFELVETDSTDFLITGMELTAEALGR